MPAVQWKKEGTVALIEMCNGDNRHNMVFATQMNQCVDEILEDPDVSSMVLTSSDEKNFSQGVDVEWLGQRFAAQEFEEIKTFMYKMNDLFKRLLLMPVPVIAAVNGHAFGNGAILSCACDFRFMKKDRGYFCFPEVDVSIPFLPGMIAFVKKALPEYLFNDLLLSGRRTTAEELAAAHAIVKASDDQTALMSDAMAYAATFTKKRGIFGELKKRKHKGIVRVIETEDPEFIDSLSLMVAE